MKAIWNTKSLGLILKASLLSSVFVTQCVNATDYFVAVTGSDSNPGSKLAPWRTAQRAVASAVAGDSVYFRAGTYTEQLKALRSGAPGKYITFSGYPGEEAIFDGSGVALPQFGGLVEVTYSSYIKVQGLKVTNSSIAGIFVGNSNNVSVSNSVTFNTVSSGIGVWGSDQVTVEGNEVLLANNDGIQENITIADTSNFSVINNHVHSGGPATNGGEGIDVKGASHDGKVYGNHVHDLNRQGIYVDAWDKNAYNIEIFNNSVHNNKSCGIAISSEQGGVVNNIKIYNNLVYYNQVFGIYLPYIPASVNKLSNIYINNNTIYNNGWGWGGGLAIEAGGANNVDIRNNIVSGHVGFGITVSNTPKQQVIVDHNLIDPFIGYFPDEAGGSSRIQGDPKFANIALGNFRLQTDSPAIDTGTNINAPSIDLDFQLRPQGGSGSYDIGAYEWVAVAAAPVAVIPTGTVTVNPVKPVAQVSVVTPKKRKRRS